MLPSLRVFRVVPFVTSLMPNPAWRNEPWRQRSGIMRDTMLEQVVLDTNVLVAGMRSSRGASHRILQWIGTGRFGTHVSVPLVLEYEEILLRKSPELGISPADIRDFLDYICSVSTHHAIDFLWRPLLRDPDDDMVLELAVQAGCRDIVTHNIRDFAGAESLGVHAILPRTFLNRIGGKR